MSEEEEKHDEPSGEPFFKQIDLEDAALYKWLHGTGYNQFLQLPSDEELAELSPENSEELVESEALDLETEETAHELALKQLEVRQKEAEAQKAEAEADKANSDAIRAAEYSKNLPGLIKLLKWVGISLLFIAIILTVLCGMGWLTIHHTIIVSLIGGGLIPIFSIIVKLYQNKG